MSLRTRQTGTRREGRRPAFAVFARAPVAGTTKTRLARLLGPQAAARFQAALTSDALRKIAGLRKPCARYLFVAGSAGSGLGSWYQHASEFTLFTQRGPNLGARLENAFGQLLSRHTAAIIIGTDSPLVPAKTLLAARRELEWCEAVLGPCPDGGYYLIGLRRFAPGLLRCVRWGSAFAFRDTLEGLLRRGFSCAILRPFPDVDRPRDLERLRAEMIENQSARRLAPATWRFVREDFTIRGGFRPGPRVRASRQQNFA